MTANAGDEERPLLEDEQQVQVQPTKPATSPFTWKIWIWASLSALVLLSVGVAAYFGARTSKQPTRDAALFSNGTHTFKRTVILVSIDGLRQVVCCSHYTFLSQYQRELPRPWFDPPFVGYQQTGIESEIHDAYLPSQSIPLYPLLLLSCRTRR